MELLDKLGSSIKGSVLIIGYDDKSVLIDNLNKNKKVIELYSLTDDNRYGRRPRKKKRLNAAKKIDIKKLRKVFKKQRFDAIICDFETILPFFRSFIRNSITLSNDMVYLYVKGNDYNHDEINKRFSRYGSKVEKIGFKNEFLFKIDVHNTKIPFFKNIIYWWRDLMYDIFEFIANILIN